MTPLYGKCLIIIVLTAITELCVAQQCSTPNISLPWGAYCSNTYDSKNDIYTFQNVRFGAATNGKYRFHASDYPTTRSNKKTVESGDSCPQVSTQGPDGPVGCIPGGNLLAPAFRQSEDCLFLDIYVPGSVLTAAQKSGVANTPVVVWLFGGAFVFGSKDFLAGGPDLNPMYNGTGLLMADTGNVIFVAGNYRLGAFGWLAGTTMESQGLPNAGLSDQRLLFRFVQDFIHLVGGDKKQVNAWGESAGAGSILHHLISRDPRSETGALMKPNFTRAAIQSPAYEWQWDPNTLEGTFQSFASLALNKDCTQCSVSDLQSLDEKTLRAANQRLYQTTTPCTGLFPIGPSVDGKVITEISPVALSGKAGQNFSLIESIIVSHCTNEAEGFIPPPLNATNNPNSTTWDTFMSEFVPETNALCIRDDINKQYPISNFDDSYTERAKTVIQDAVFVCNVRQLFDAYAASNVPTDFYAMSWDFGNLVDVYAGNLAQHATDLPALFFNKYWNLYGFMQGQIRRQRPDWYQVAINAAAGTYDDAFNFNVAGTKAHESWYQSFWKAHAIHGEPNKGWNAFKKWKPAALSSDDDGDQIQNVFQVQNAMWESIADPQTSRTNCQFWTDTAVKVTKILQGTYQCPVAGDSSSEVIHEEL